MSTSRRSMRPLAARHEFARRVLRGALISLGIVGTGLAMGATGYHALEGMPWLDAVLNAAMLLAGEGPLSPIRTPAGKVFAAFYALFSGVVFVSAVSTLLAPVARRFLHRFHLDLAEDVQGKTG